MLPKRCGAIFCLMRRNAKQQSARGLGIEEQRPGWMGTSREGVSGGGFVAWSQRAFDARERQFVCALQHRDRVEIDFRRNTGRIEHFQ